MSDPVDLSRSPRAGFRIEDTHGLDSVDMCLRRLLTLRTRIDTNWPGGGRLFGRRHDLKPETEALIADLLTSLPTPLPVVAGGAPEKIIGPADTDLRSIAGRAVDVGLALLDGATLDTPYPAEVTMLETRRYDAAGPISVSEATVGLLVATIIGTLEAISEIILPPAKAAPKQESPGGGNAAEAGARPAELKRGPSVPRI